MRGRATPVERFEGVYQRISLPKGTSAVEFSYEPPGASIAWLAALLGVLAMFSGFAAAFLCYRPLPHVQAAWFAIGAMTPLSVLERSAAMRAHAPVVTRTLRTLSNVRVRNVATIGGHLAHADPHMDLPPVLIALGAHIAVAGPAGERTIPVENLFAGYFETVLRRDELITAVVVPAQGSRRAAGPFCIPGHDRFC